MKRIWNEIILLACIFSISFFVSMGVMGWFIYLKLPHKALGFLFIIPAFVFLECYFWCWARVRFDMYIETVGEAKSTYVRIGSDNFLVPKGQELVIRQSDEIPGKLEVFTGPVT